MLEVLRGPRGLDGAGHSTNFDSKRLGSHRRGRERLRSIRTNGRSRRVVSGDDVKRKAHGGGGYIECDVQGWHSNGTGKPADEVAPISVGDVLDAAANEEAICKRGE